MVLPRTAGGRGKKARGDPGLLSLLSVVCCLVCWCGCVLCGNNSGKVSITRKRTGSETSYSPVKPRNRLGVRPQQPISSSVGTALTAHSRVSGS